MVDLMGLLSDALIGSFQMLMLNDLGKNMFPYRIKTCWKRILIYGVTALVILGVNHIESTFINIMMVPVSYTIAAIVISQGSVWKKIILACCYYMLAIVPEFLFAVITGAYGVTGTENNFHSELEKLLSLLLMSTITFLLVKCVNQITRKKNYQTIENKLFTVLLTLPAATIIIFMCIYYSHISFTGVNRIMIPIGAALLLMTNICIFAVFDKLIEKSEEVKKMELLYQKSKAENINQKYINKVNEDKRVFLHDVNKFLCTAASLIENGKNLELDSMVRHLGIRMEELKNYSYCSDPVLNSILCERKFVAESKGILYKIKLGNNLRTDFIEDLDLISIVGNLLDNAIEAAEKTKKDQHVICNMYMGNNFSQEYIQYSVEMRKKILAQTILFYMNKKGVLLKDIPCTLNQILKCLSVNTDNNDIIYRWIELLKKYNYVTETDGIYVCKIEIYEKGLKYGWEEVEYLWKGKLESPLVLDYIINNIKNWDKLIQKEQQATLLLFEQGEDIYADALYKETKILQYLNHSLSKKVLGYLYENANATILEIGAGTGATSDKVLSDIRENKFEEHIVYFYTDISRFFLQRAKERYKECDGKIEMHYQTLDIDEAFSSQLPSNFQADIVIAVGVLNNSVNTDKCIYEINSVMKPGGILLIIETVEDVPDILITQSFMMTEPKDQRKATNTMFLNRKQWLEILEENGFCNSEEFPGYGEYLEVLGQKLFYCTKE